MTAMQVDTILICTSAALGAFCWYKILRSGVRVNWLGFNSPSIMWKAMGISGRLAFMVNLIVLTAAVAVFVIYIE